MDYKVYVDDPVLSKPGKTLREVFDEEEANGRRIVVRECMGGDPPARVILSEDAPVGNPLTDGPVDTFISSGKAAVPKEPVGVVVAGGSEKSPDMVNHPPHYKFGDFEAIQICERFGFCRGNAVKYLLRAGRKGGAKQQIEDLEKAIWYINRELAGLRGGE